MPKQKPTPPTPPQRRLKGWRYKGNGAAIIGLPQRDISYAEALKKPRWLDILQQVGIQRYYLPEYTRPDKGEH